MRINRSLILAAMVLGLATLVVPSGTLPASAFSQVLKWRIVKSPSGGPQPAKNQFLAVADLSSTNAWAVGTRSVSVNFPTATLAEHWDGMRWSVVSTPKVFQPTAQLNSITTDAQSDVFAAGFSDDPSCLCGKTLVERWTGQSWMRIPTPNPNVADYIDGIAAPSASDVWVVGQRWITQQSFEPLIMHFDGHLWKAVDTSQLVGGNLFTIFASASNDIWAIGDVGRIGQESILALHFNGSSWRQVAFPPDQADYTIIRSVSGTGRNDVWAAGFESAGGFEFALMYHWDGTAWTQVDVANLSQPSYFVGVKAIAPDDVWAIGQGVVEPNNNNVQNITYHWNGSGWSNVPNPDDLQEAVYSGIAASSSEDVWAVGYGMTETPPHQGTFTMHYAP